MAHVTKLKRVLAGLTVLLVLLFAASLTLAQEATAAATEATATTTTTAPPGGGLLFLLIGLGAIGLIALIWRVRERTEPANETVG